MIKSAVIASLIASAAAFAPASTSGRTSTKLFSDEGLKERSYQPSQAIPFLEYPPNLKGYVGDAGFDPFRFSDFLPMDFLRESELKHGRICMMAIVGFVAVDSGLRVIPEPDAFKGLTAITAHDALVQYGSMQQMLLWFSFAEVFATIGVVQMLEGSGRAPGDYGFDPLKLLGNTPEKQENMMLKEITHCRLAMLAFGGIVTQAVLSQGPFPYLVNN